MLRVVAAVMQIGQIEFESAMGASGDEKALVVGGEESPTLALVSSLLNCAPADLRAVLETRHISARTEVRFWTEIGDDFRRFVDEIWPF